MKLNLRTRQLMIVGLALLVVFGATTFATRAAQPVSPAAGSALGGAEQSFNFLAAFDASAAFMQSGNSLAIIAPDGQTSLGTSPVRIVVRVSNQAHGFRALLNRRDITAKFTRASNTACLFTVCELVAEVTPNDGLLTGRNELHVFSNRGGARESAQQTFNFVATTTANAGPDLRQKVGQAVQLDGTGSTAGSPGTGSLTHRWELVRRPAGSNAQLDDPTSPRPSFVPDVHGTYVAQLIVNHGGFNSAPDTVNISATPATTPVYVETFNTNGGINSIQVGGKLYSQPDRAAQAVLVLVLDRETLEEVAFQSFPGNASQAPLITSFLQQNAPNSDRIVIFQTGVGGTGFDNKLIAKPVLEQYGVTSEIETLGPNDPYSFIGVRGWKPGQAYQVGGNNFFPGYFTPDVQDNFTFILPYYESYQLVPAAPGAGFGLIKVSGNEYRAAGASGQNGFHLVVVDRRLPAQRLIEERVYDVSTGLKDNQGTTLGDKLNALANDENNLVFLVSYGHPGASANYNQLVRQQHLPQAVARLGGNQYLILTLGATDTYSLVGAGTIAKVAGVEPFPAVEGSSLLTPRDKSGAVQGLLARGRRGNWFEPFGSPSDVNSPIPLNFYQIAWQPPVAWPEMDTPGKQKAYQYLSRVTGCINPNDTSPACRDVRSKYTDFKQAPSLWYTNAVNQKGKCTADISSQNGFTCDEFEAVRGQLQNEYYYLTLVLKLRDAMHVVATEIQSNIALTPGAIAQEVKEAIKPPEGAEILFKIFDIFLEFASVAGEVSGEEGLSAGAGFLSGMLGLGELAATGSGGEPGGEVDAKVAELEKKASEAFPAVLKGIDLIFHQIVSDWAKLQLVGQRRDESDPAYKWDDGDMVEVARVALRRYYYQQLLAVTYGIDEIHAQPPGASVPRGLACTPPYNYWLVPEQASVHFPTLRWPQDKDKVVQPNYNDFFIITLGAGDVNFAGRTPPVELLEKVFTSPRENKDGLGVSPYDFFIKWPFTHRRNPFCQEF